jgi:hypothetical protein
MTRFDFSCRDGPQDLLDRKAIGERTKAKNAVEAADLARAGERELRQKREAAEAALATAQARLSELQAECDELDTVVPEEGVSDLRANAEGFRAALVKAAKRYRLLAVATRWAGQKVPAGAGHLRVGALEEVRQRALVAAQVAELLSGAAEEVREMVVEAALHRSDLWRLLEGASRVGAAALQDAAELQGYADRMKAGVEATEAEGEAARDAFQEAREREGQAKEFKEAVQTLWIRAAQDAGLEVTEDDLAAVLEEQEGCHKGVADSPGSVEQTEAAKNPRGGPVAQQFGPPDLAQTCEEVSASAGGEECSSSATNGCLQGMNEAHSIPIGSKTSAKDSEDAGRVVEEMAVSKGSTAATADLGIADLEGAHAGSNSGDPHTVRASKRAPEGSERNGNDSTVAVDGWVGMEGSAVCEEATAGDSTPVGACEMGAAGDSTERCTGGEDETPGECSNLDGSGGMAEEATGGADAAAVGSGGCGIGEVATAGGSGYAAGVSGAVTSGSLVEIAFGDTSTAETPEKGGKLEVTTIGTETAAAGSRLESSGGAAQGMDREAATAAEARHAAGGRDCLAQALMLEGGVAASGAASSGDSALEVKQDDVDKAGEAYGAASSGDAAQGVQQDEAEAAGEASEAASSGDAAQDVQQDEAEAAGEASGAASSGDAAQDVQQDEAETGAEGYLRSKAKRKDGIRAEEASERSEAGTREAVPSASADPGETGVAEQLKRSAQGTGDPSKSETRCVNNLVSHSAISSSSKNHNAKPGGESSDRNSRVRESCSTGAICEGAASKHPGQNAAGQCTQDMCGIHAVDAFSNTGAVDLGMSGAAGVSPDGCTAAPPDGVAMEPCFNAVGRDSNSRGASEGVGHVLNQLIRECSAEAPCAAVQEVPAGVKHATADVLGGGASPDEGTEDGAPGEPAGKDSTKREESEERAASGGALALAPAAEVVNGVPDLTGGEGFTVPGTGPPSAGRAVGIRPADDEGGAGGGERGAHPLDKGTAAEQPGEVNSGSSKEQPADIVAARYEIPGDVVVGGNKRPEGVDEDMEAGVDNRDASQMVEPQMRGATKGGTDVADSTELPVADDSTLEGLESDAEGQEGLPEEEGKAKELADGQQELLLKQPEPSMTEASVMHEHMIEPHLVEETHPDTGISEAIVFDEELPADRVQSNLQRSQAGKAALRSGYESHGGGRSGAPEDGVASEMLSTKTIKIEDATVWQVHVSAAGGESEEVDAAGVDDKARALWEAEMCSGATKPAASKKGLLRVTNEEVLQAIDVAAAAAAAAKRAARAAEETVKAVRGEVVSAAGAWQTSKMRLDRAKEAADLAVDRANKAEKEARECDPV